MFIGINMGVRGGGYADTFAPYVAPSGFPPSLVLAFSSQIYAIDLTWWLISLYNAPSGTPPTLILGMAAGQYASSPTGWYLSYVAPNGTQPSLILDTANSVYGVSQ